MHIIPLFIIVLCEYQIVGERRIKRVNVDVKIKEGTNDIEVSKGESGNVIVYSIKPKIDCGFRKISDDKCLFYLSKDGDNFEALKVLYTKGIKGPFIVKLRFKKGLLSRKSTYTYYMRFADEWRMITDTIFNYVIDKLNESKPNSKGKVIPPKFIKVDLNNRKSNDALDVERNKEGDDKWNIRFTPKKGCHILIITAGKGCIWILGEDYKVPSEVNVTISDEVVVSLTFKDHKLKSAPSTLTYKLYPGASKDTVSGHDDTDITKKATLISSMDDGEEEDEEGVIEDRYDWTQGIDVTEEEAEKLAEYLQRKERGEGLEEEKHELVPEADLREVEGVELEEGSTPSGEDIGPEADLRETEGEIIEEGVTPSGEEVEHEVDLEEVKESTEEVQEPIKDVAEGLYESIDVDDLIVRDVEDIEVDVLLLDPSCHVKRTYGETTHTMAFISPNRAVKVKYGDLLLWESKNIDEHCKIIDVFSKDGNELITLSILNDRTSSILPGFYRCSRDFECYRFNYENFVYMWDEFKFTFDTIGDIIDYSDYSRVMEIVGEPDGELPYGRCGIDDYFKDLNPITLDIYNHETEGLEVKVKEYPKYTSTIHTCRPNDGYILDSVYDSQRNEMLWKRYKNNKYGIATLVNANYLELIVIFVIDVNPQKSEVIYYKYSLLYGWEEYFRESLTKCYLDTVIKGEWRISEKFL